ncbi:MarR family winged helix-turn-helix transcriptional regulator [Hydrogenophaga sp. OTU3427]|jgi:DNA-binding MarR family transcriptional regulator|uniref:MarR family winged helix-turn-helix transcriptional regulator n=1 Tax=Hydrogenophaga sp. OTU3427 TaxID=3043856 RepID=UPI00313BC570
MPHPDRPAAFYDANKFCAEESVGYLMKRVMLSLGQQIDKRLAAYDLTTAQWNPLMYLKKNGRSTVAELARWQVSDAGAMTRLLDRLEKKGLCKRERSLEDRRVVHVELTEEGAKALEHVPAMLSEVLNHHLAGFDDTELQTLVKLLRRMIANGEHMRDGP